MAYYDPLNPADCERFGRQVSHVALRSTINRMYTVPSRPFTRRKHKVGLRAGRRALRFFRRGLARGAVGGQVRSLTLLVNEPYGYSRSLSDGSNFIATLYDKVGSQSFGGLVLMIRNYLGYFYDLKKAKTKEQRADCRRRLEMRHNDRFQDHYETVLLPLWKRKQVRSLLSILFHPFHAV